MWGKATETETSQAGEATTNQPNNQPTKQAYKACKIWDRGKEHSKSFVYRSCSASGVPSSSDVPRYMRLLLPTTLLIFFITSCFILFSLLTLVCTYFLFLRLFMFLLCAFCSLSFELRRSIVLLFTSSLPLIYNFLSLLSHYFVSQPFLVSSTHVYYVVDMPLCCVSVFGEDVYIFISLGLRCQRALACDQLVAAHVAIESRTRIRFS